MSASEIELRTLVIQHLKINYDMDELTANNIREQTMTLYHRLSTYTDLTSLQSIDDKILSSLIVVISNYYDFQESSRFYLSVMMYIVISCHKHHSEYVFTQWISMLAQSQEINDGLEVFAFILKELRKYFNTTTNLSIDSFRDLFTALKNNINSLEEIINEERGDEQQIQIAYIKKEFNLYLSEIQLQVSDDSDEADDVHGKGAVRGEGDVRSEGDVRGEDDQKL